MESVSRDCHEALAPFRVTRREAEVAYLLTWHLTNEELAERLGISVSTVKQRVLRLRQKTKSGNRRSLAIAVKKALEDYRSGD